MKYNLMSIIDKIKENNQFNKSGFLCSYLIQYIVIENSVKL